MSVVFTTVTEEYIVLCADKQVTNMGTGEAQVNVATKIEKWTPSIGVGWAGNAALADIIISAVKGVVGKTKINSFTLEDLADLFAQAYYAARDEYPDMPADAIAKFAVTGRLSTGKLGIIQIIDGNDIADTEVFEAQPHPITLIFDPEDLSSEECNQLLTKALVNTRNKKTYGQDLLETAYRKAVRYVSEHSKYVGPKSDYLIIELT